MGKSSYLRRWYLLFIAILLAIPLLHLFNSITIPPKIKKISTGYEFLADSGSLSVNIARLISNGHAYIIRSDDGYLEKFNEYATTVTREEMSLYNGALTGEEKEKLAGLINLTREYITFVKDKVAQAKKLDASADLIIYLEQHEELAARLQETSSQIQSARHDILKRDTSNIVFRENIVNIAATLLFLLGLVLLIVGTRKLILPMLIKYGRSDTIIELTRTAVLIIDRRGKITKVNQAAEKLLQIPAAEMINQPLNDMTALHPPLLTLTKFLFDVLLKEEKISNNQTAYCSGGPKTLISADYFPLYYFGKLTGAAMIAYSAEISKDKRYLFDAIESERKKISIEIHDWIGRSMSPIIHALDYTMRSAEEKMPGQVYKDLVRLRGHCQAAAMDMRSIMNDIHPYLIDKVGLVSALESYAHNFEQMHDVKVYLFYQNKNLHVDRRTEIIIYRIIQEALVNVGRHSNASEVDIYFMEEDDILKVEVVDNGDAPDNFAAGTGLWGMKERAGLIGSDLVYDSGESGFSIILTVPLAVEDEKNE